MQAAILAQEQLKMIAQHAILMLHWIRIQDQANESALERVSMELPRIVWLETVAETLVPEEMQTNELAVIQMRASQVGHVFAMMDGLEARTHARHAMQSAKLAKE